MCEVDILESQWHPMPAPKDGIRVLMTHQDDYLLYAETVEWMDGGWFNGELIQPEDHFTHWMFIPPISGVPSNRSLV